MKYYKLIPNELELQIIKELLEREEETLLKVIPFLEQGITRNRLTLRQESIVKILAHITYVSRHPTI